MNLLAAIIDELGAALAAADPQLRLHDEVPPAAQQPYSTLGPVQQINLPMAGHDAIEHRIALQLWHRGDAADALRSLGQRCSDSLARAPRSIDGWSNSGLRIVRTSLTRDVRQSQLLLLFDLRLRSARKSG